MELILTSSPCDNNVPAGLSQPCIFNAANGFTRRLQCDLPRAVRCLIIAASPDAYALNDEMRDTFHKCFAQCGFSPLSAEILDNRNALRISELIAGSNVIILGGGHVPTQNAFFTRIGLKEYLMHYDGTVIGISAGSMNCAETVYAIPEEPGEAVSPDYRRFIPGLGLCGISVIPHLNRMRSAVLDGMRLFEDIAFVDSAGRSFYAIPDGSYILIRSNSRPKIYGEAYLIRDDVMLRVCEYGGYTEI